MRNHVLGYDSLEIEYLAGGALQIRRTAVEAESALAGTSLADADLPKDCLVLAFISNGQVTVPTGADRLRVGDDVVLFVQRDEVDIVYLLFPGSERG